jgi:DNA repair photolyase
MRQTLQKIKRKSLLYKSGVEYADFCINHVEGCSHGCKYPCYAFLLRKRCRGSTTYAKWCNPKIVENALELLDEEIPKYKSKIKYVHLCFSTDPFMHDSLKFKICR